MFTEKHPKAGSSKTFKLQRFRKKFWAKVMKQNKSKTNELFKLSQHFTLTVKKIMKNTLIFQLKLLCLCVLNRKHCWCWFKARPIKKFPSNQHDMELELLNALDNRASPQNNFYYWKIDILSRYVITLAQIVFMLITEIYRHRAI